MASEIVRKQQRKPIAFVLPYMAKIRNSRMTRLGHPGRIEDKKTTTTRSNKRYVLCVVTTCNAAPVFCQWKKFWPAERT